MSTIFYSWQSDLPNNTNRTFIEGALNKALVKLAHEPDVYQPPREVDRDTQGVAGSPKIADTIFDKIDSASACVFDVSIIGRAGERPCPNPNVLVELGYALKAHPDTRVIMMMNSQTGKKEDLPFDLRFRRVLDYDPVEVDGDRSRAKAELVRDLTAALKATFAHNEANRFSEEEKQFFVDVYSNVRGFLDSVDEYDDRCLKPWVDLLREGWAHRAEGLRKAVSTDVSTKWSDVASSTSALAGSLDGLVNFQRSLTSGNEFKTRLRAIADKATGLLSACTEPIRGDFEGKSQGKRKRELSRRALAELDRLRAGLEAGDSPPIEAARRAMSQVGGELLQLSAELEVAGDADAAVLRPAAHALHVAEVEKSQAMGFREETELLQRLAPLVEKLRGFTLPS